MAAPLPFLSPFPGEGPPVRNTSETAYISPLALLKILVHAGREAPVSVMGVLLGKVVDAFTLLVVDAFAMPRCAVGVSKEALDRDYQDRMVAMLKQTYRLEDVVGWYRSNPGFSCLLSDSDAAIQKRFEELNPRAMAVVIDPMKSVNGNFVIDAFRTYTRSSETTSNVGSLHGRSYYQYKSIYGNRFFQGFAPGAHSWYYSILISHRKNDLEIHMLKSMDRKSRTHSSNLKDFTVRPFSDVAESNKKGVERSLRSIPRITQARMRSIQWFAWHALAFLRVHCSSPRMRCDGLIQKRIESQQQSHMILLSYTSIYHIN